MLRYSNSTTVSLDMPHHNITELIFNSVLGGTVEAGALCVPLLYQVWHVDSELV